MVLVATNRRVGAPPNESQISGSVLVECAFGLSALPYWFVVIEPLILANSSWTRSTRARNLLPSGGVATTSTTAPKARIT